MNQDNLYFDQVVAGVSAAMRVPVAQILAPFVASRDKMAEYARDYVVFLLRGKAGQRGGPMPWSEIARRLSYPDLSLCHAARDRVERDPQSGDLLPLIAAEVVASMPPLP